MYEKAAQAYIKGGKISFHQHNQSDNYIFPNKKWRFS
jgi:hypothetical protein